MGVPCAISLAKPGTDARKVMTQALEGPTSRAGGLQLTLLEELGE